MEPEHEKLSWPGLRAKDHLSRVATRAVKEAKEKRENELWAESLIARVLDYVPPETAVKLILQETHRRRKLGGKGQALAKRMIGLRVGRPALTGQGAEGRRIANKRKQSRYPV